MSSFSNTVEEYRIRFLGQSTGGPQDLKAWLCLYGPGHASGVVGTIYFYPDAALSTKQDCLDALGRPQGNMSISEIGPVLDMLRDEDPIYIYWVENLSQVWLETGNEPVGDFDF